MISVLSWTLLHGPKSSCKRYSKSDEVLHQRSSARKVFMNMETRGQDWKRVRKLLKKSVPSGTFQRPKMHSLDASF